MVITLSRPPVDIELSVQMAVCVHRYIRPLPLLTNAVFRTPLSPDRIIVLARWPNRISHSRCVERENSEVIDYA